MIILTPNIEAVNGYNAAGVNVVNLGKQSQLTLGLGLRVRPEALDSFQSFQISLDTSSDGWKSWRDRPMPPSLRLCSPDFRFLDCSQLNRTLESVPQNVGGWLSQYTSGFGVDFRLFAVRRDSSGNHSRVCSCPLPRTINFAVEDMSVKMN
jgi:hypothetical protein